MGLSSGFFIIPTSGLTCPPIDNTISISMGMSRNIKNILGGINFTYPNCSETWLVVDLRTRLGNLANK